MFFLGPILILGAIGFFCWLLFLLAVYAPPFYAGIVVFFAAYHSGAGVIGSLLVGCVAAGATFGAGQLLLGFAPWLWLRLLTILAFTVPSIIAGYAATLGIARLAMPSPAWQMVFAGIGAVAVGMTSFIRITFMATVPAPTGPRLALREQHVAMGRMEPD